MKAKHCLNSGLVLGYAAWFLAGCTSEIDEYQQYRKQQQVEGATPAFNPAHFKEAERRHVAVFFEIVGGNLQLAARPAQLRPGNLPYRSQTAGDVVVVYRDNAGKELGRYATLDPILARSCDSEKRRVGELKPLPDGLVVEVLLPYDPHIQTVDIGRPGKEPLSFRIGGRIDGAVKAKEATSER